MIRPPSPRSIMARAKAVAVMKAPVRFTSMTRRHSSSPISTACLSRRTPALATAQSTRPRRSTTVRAAAAIAASSVTSSAIAMARPGASRSSARAAASAFSAATSMTATEAPCAT